MQGYQNGEPFGDLEIVSRERVASTLDRMYRAGANEVRIRPVVVDKPPPFLKPLRSKRRVKNKMAKVSRRRNR